MKKYLLILLVVIFWIVPIVVHAGQWYENGNLHRKTLADWKTASYANKLATAADMSLASPKVKSKVQKSGSVNTLKPYAKELVICIDEASAGQGYDNMSIAEIAASCMIMMGWK